MGSEMCIRDRSDTLAALDTFFALGSMSGVPVRALKRLATIDVGTSTLLHARFVADSEELATSQSLPYKGGVLSDATRCMITVLNPCSFRSHSTARPWLKPSVTW